MPCEVHSALAYFPGKYICSAALGAPSVRTAQSSRMFSVVDPNYQRLNARKGLRGTPFWDIIGMKFTSKKFLR
eukprot:1442517-Pyramimonas_sp.AAC.1